MYEQQNTANDLTEKQKEQLLSRFCSEKVRVEVVKIIGYIELMFRKEPEKGFEPKFYVPGWIGAIQELVVDIRMSNFSAKPFIDNMGYRDFRDWIIDEMEFIADQQALIECDIEEEKAELAKQNELIFVLFNTLIKSWAQCAPEVAFHLVAVDSNHYMAEIGLLYKAMREKFEKIGYEVKPSESSNDSSDAGAQAIYFLGILINILTLIAIGWIISLFC